MKTLGTLLLCILLSPALAFGAQVYGTLTVGNTSVGKGIKVEILCMGKVVPGETDDYGTYKVYAPKGKCTFKVYYGGQEISHDVYSYDDPVRYDFELVPQGDGRYSLKRR